MICALFVVIRVDCVPVHKAIKGHISEELLPSETVIDLNNLCEKTEYDVTITAVTGEFFDSLPAGHEWRLERQIPSDVNELPENPWLPKSTITVSFGSPPVLTNTVY